MSGLGSVVVVLVVASVASAQMDFDVASIIGRETMGGVNGLPRMGGAGVGEGHSNGLRGGWDGNPNRRPGFGHQHGTVDVGFESPIGSLGHGSHHDTGIGHGMGGIEPGMGPGMGLGMGPGIGSDMGHGFDAGFGTGIGAGIGMNPIGPDMLPFDRDFGGPIGVGPEGHIPEFLDPVTGHGVHVPGQSIYGGKPVIPKKGKIPPKKAIKPPPKKSIKPIIHKPKDIEPPKKYPMPKKPYLGAPIIPIRRRFYGHRMFPKKLILTKRTHFPKPRMPYLSRKSIYRSRVKKPILGHKSGYLPPMAHNPFAKKSISKKRPLKGGY